MEDKIKHLAADVALFKKKYEEEKELRESAEQDKIKIESIVKDMNKKFSAINKFSEFADIIPEFLTEGFSKQIKITLNRRQKEGLKPRRRTRR